MKIISFNFSIKNNIKIIFLILIQVIDVLLMKITEKNEIKKNEDKNIKYNYFESYLITCFEKLSYFFGIIIYLINQFISHKNEKKQLNKKFKNSFSRKSKYD